MFSLEDNMAQNRIGSNGRGVYLENAHYQMIKNLVRKGASWSAFASIINCTNLVLSLANKLEKKKQLERHRIDQVNHRGIIYTV